MTDLNDIMMQARQMQENFQKAQKEMEKLTVDGESGAGLVKVRMNGKHDVVSVVLDDSLFEEDKPVIEDLIGAAVNDAVRKLEEKSQQSLGGLAQNFKMPDGFKFPF
tara:strand:+ start:232 stop:552 length:321 start_codon:yes stop_codon:yes gene_type:complete